MERPIGWSLTPYVGRVLAPTLQPEQVVVWGNLSAHKSLRTRAAIEAAGCAVVFLGAYSPDFNPIERAFAKLKTELRWAEEWTHAEVWEAIGSGLEQITSPGCAWLVSPCWLSVN